MKVTVDVKILLGAIQSYNPEADLTGVKAYLFDLAIDGFADSPAPTRQPTPPREQPVTALTNAVDPERHRAYEPEPVDGIGTFAEELSPFPPSVPLTGDTLEEDDPIQTMAQKVSVPAASAQPRAAVQSTRTGPPTRRSPKDRKEEKEAKRKEMADIANLTSKELMERLTNTASFTMKKKDGHNQFIDAGDDSASAGGGDLDIG